MTDVKVPKVGKVPRKVIVPVVAVAGGYIAWRYWKARQVPAGDATATDSGYEDPGVLPAVQGAVRPDGTYGSGDSTQTSDSSAITTNAQWTQYAATQLSQSDRFDYADVLSALGNWLTGAPLTDQQQVIVRAAIGVAGYPPVGGDRPIVGGGNTAITIAPSGVVVTGITATSAQVTFQPVSGARTYNVYRSGSAVASGTASGSPVTIDGLTPGTAYTVSVAAVSAAGSVGPKSAAVSFRTPAVTVATPARPTLVSVTNSRATVQTGKVPYATSYRWFLNGKMANSTDGPIVTLTRLAPRTKYSVFVQADTSTGNPSKSSATLTFTTK
jgi:hypothetical protein